MNYPANMLLVLYEHPQTRPMYDIDPIVRTHPSLLARARRLFASLRPASAPECECAEAHAHA